LADRAGAALVDLRDSFGAGYSPWALRDRGDLVAHELLVDLLAEHRPDDIVMSEEGADDPRRLDAARCWIVDPLDGTYDYPFPDSIEWAVHVAIVEHGMPTAAAVSVPGMGEVFATDDRHGPAERTERDEPLVVSGRSAGYAAAAVAEQLGGKLTACGSAGVKAMLVVSGAVDVYVHSSGLWEWDVCAPAAVAAANGLVVTDIDGDPILYNKSRPIVRGLVISRPEFAATTRATLDELI
jgi:3'(2'), 5'-bisphosphate nucleotidase